MSKSRQRLGKGGSYGSTKTNDQKHRLKPYMVRVWDNGRQKTLGHYATQSEADLAYDHYILHHRLDLFFNFHPLTKERIAGKMKLSAKDFWAGIDLVVKEGPSVYMKR